MKKGSKKDITGQKFGMLTALELVGIEQPKSRAIWKFMCDCGKIVVIKSDSPIHGKTKSCGCIPRKNRKDLTGKKFGRLTAIVPVGKNRRAWIWLAKCECGGEAKATVRDLTSGHTMSCGCLRVEAIVKKFYKGPTKAIISALYGRYRASALERNLFFCISKDFFSSLIFKNCFYCNSIPNNKVNSKNNKETLFYSGIDRKNNNLGYEEGNCVPCCIFCNLSKRSRTYEEFTAYLKQVASVWKDVKD